MKPDFLRCFIELMYFVFALSLLFVSASCSKDTNKPNNLNNYIDYQFEEPSVSGSTYYIDPENGSSEGDGSVSNPWRTLQEVIESNLVCYHKHTENRNPDSPLEIVNEEAPVKGGDRLILKEGYHGYISCNNFIFLNWLTIEGEEGGVAVLSQFRLEGAFAKLYLKNITISKDSYEGEDDYWEVDAINHNSNACVYLASSDFWGRGSDIKLNNLTLRTTTNTESWTAADWVEKSSQGIGVRGVPNTEILNCNITNVSFGISLSDNSINCKVVGNNIRNYSGDGARILSDEVYFAYNIITDCYKVDDNHDDAIQSYTRSDEGNVGEGVIRNVVIRGNLIIGTTNFENPLAGSPQGIGCFDGFFENWTVENNIVIVDHYHGISFYGMRRGIIAHNTVIDQIPGNDVSPWVMVTDHKNNTPSESCLVANNIAFRSVSAEGVGVVAENNYIIGRDNFSILNELFTDPDEFDMHLLDNTTTRGSIIDAGLKYPEMISSEWDFENNLRDDYPDLGAFEFLSR